MKKVIVAGAGILGASTAYHLAKDGAEVIIVDRFDEGQATDSAAGMICPWLSQRRNKAWYQLAKGGARYFPDLVQQLAGDGEENTGYYRSGTLFVHSDKEKLEKKIKMAEKRREDAPEMGEITSLSPEETQRYFPPLKEGYHGVLVSGGARVDGRAMRKALIRGAARHGAVFVEGDATLTFDGNRVTGVQVNDETFEADEVVVTAGAWSKDMVKPLGIDLDITYQKGQVVHLEIPGVETHQWPVIMPPNDQHILAFESGRIVIGATHEDDTGLDVRVTAGGVSEVLGKALDVAPGLSESTIMDTRTGFRPYTPGSLPVIGPLPGFEGIYLANGLGASGLTSGPYLGRELAKLVLHKQTEIDISLYDVKGAIQT
ncbi:FAD-binding oxidoreductase [Virgibacillus sp. MSP4-1]|uniref:NAD(P)/FAD-dependent oxidoreductase n=1 Tax=Virgibacillus sp. MSP4-1 TaxID=2700081 RepID=UPI0003A53E24|nr:FAD-binding oxidoreductase [Virgibacillus sp. MSP4-1]QHS24252.1 FAD-binding oxidoreductase [Virgibacillus sp. MSP4-1]